MTVTRVHNVSHNADMVRHANATSRVHDRNRSYAVDAMKKKLTDATDKVLELSFLQASHARFAARARWRWALGQVTTGA